MGKWAGRVHIIPRGSATMSHSSNDGFYDFFFCLLFMKKKEKKRMIEETCQKLEEICQQMKIMTEKKGRND